MIEHMLEPFKDELFKNRVPEAAAHQLAIVLSSAVEAHLAILAAMQLSARCPKADLARQRAICDELVAQCMDLNIFPSGLRGERCERLRSAMGVQ